MMSPTQFRADIVDIFVQRFRSNPNSLADAFGTIWAIDAYAVHCAVFLEQSESDFKTEICDSGCWEYRLLREACNATKHAVRKREKTDDVRRSDDVNISDHVEGWAAYFSSAKHWGPQVCIDIAWQQRGQNSKWRDAKGEDVKGGGPFFPTVPVIDLIEPALASIDKALL